MRDIALQVSTEQNQLDNLESLCYFRDGTLPQGAIEHYCCEKPLIGQFVRIKILTNATVTLQFQEVEVHGFLTALLPHP